MSSLAIVDVEWLAEVFRPAREFACSTWTFAEIWEPWRRQTVTVARSWSEKTSEARNEVMTMGELFDRLLDAKNGPKSGSIVLQGAIAVSPGPRKDGDMRNMWGIGIDLDNITKGQLRRLLKKIRKANLAATITPTWSCGLEEKGACYRVFIPFDQALDIAPELWSKVYRLICEALAAPYDPKCVNKGRVLFEARRDPGRLYARARHYIGRPIPITNVVRLAETLPEGDARITKKIRKQVLPRPETTEDRERFDNFWHTFKSKILVTQLALDFGVDAKEIHKNGKIKVVCRCPLEHEHTDPDQKGEPVVLFDPAESEHGVASGMCQHTHEISVADIAWEWFQQLEPTDWRDYLMEDAKASFDTWLTIQPATRSEVEEAIESLKGLFTVDDSVSADAPAGREAFIRALRTLASRPNDPHRSNDLEDIRRITRKGKGELTATLKSASSELKERRATALRQHRNLIDADRVCHSTADYRDNLEKIKKALKVRNAEGLPLVFLQGDARVVRLISHAGKSRLELLDNPGWQVALDSMIEFRRIGRDGDRGVAIPAEYINAMKGASDLELPSLDYVVVVPLLGQDGNILVTRGYHRDLRCLIEPFADVPLPSKITKEAALEAWRYLRDITRDVPFSDVFGEESETQNIYVMNDGLRELDTEGYPVPNWSRGPVSRLHFWASVFTPFLAPILGESNIPAFHIDKATPGSGASLLLNIRSIIHTGQRAVTNTLTSDDNETRKVITSVLGQGAMSLTFDNVEEGAVHSPSLAKLITDGIWSDRILGSNKTVEVKYRGLTTISGNSLSFSKELVRRLVPIRIDAVVENPENRKGFKFDGVDALLSHVEAERANIVAAILTIARCWFLSGATKGSRSMGSFDGWARTLGGVFETVDEVAFLSTLDAYKESMKSDEEIEARATMLKLWQMFGTNKFDLEAIYNAFHGPFSGEPSAYDLASFAKHTVQKKLVDKALEISETEKVQLRRKRESDGVKFKFNRI